MTFFIQTFGCKSNQYESQAIREELTEAGFTEADDVTNAALAVVNTCSVTGRAGASCRNAVRKIRRANPSARLVLTGCGVDLGLEWPDLPGPVPLCVPNAKKHAIAEAAHVLLAEREAADTIAAAEPDRFALSISGFHNHTRAFLKIQDGCDNFCSYCAVPFARGRPVGRSPGDILDEAKRLVGNGHKEIVLTGINIGAYNRDGLELGDVALELSGTPGLERLRLGSVEPPYVTRKLVDAMAGSEVICPHIHLPLQSGDDDVLKAMGRRYCVSEFLEKADMLRSGLRLPALTTDVIVGFPGETDEAAEASGRVCGQVGFSRLHVFLFSPRPGTVAAGMRRTATDREVEARKNRVITVGKKLAEKFAGLCVGMEERVIFEKSGAGLTDRYLKARLPEVGAAGETRRIRVTGCDGEELHGEPL